MTTRKPEPILFLSDVRGVYIPRDFAESIRRECVEGVDAKTWETLEAGPDHEWYWEAFEDVMRDAIVTDDEGVRYTVYQDGDCWLIPEGMEWSDAEAWFIWPPPEPDLMACVDCYRYIANGDVPEEYPAVSPDGWGPASAAACDALTGAVCGDARHEHDFSRAQCDCCGSLLAGARYPIVLIDGAE